MDAKLSDEARAFFALGHKLAAECAQAQKPDHCPLCGTPARMYYSRCQHRILLACPPCHMGHDRRGQWTLYVGGITVREIPAAA
ncbi:MAG: hypothetical protein QOE70_4012 [Chthoniobacter sp.]|jgi:hypothetical protein|nr:hypothetical protein [Chthoniobacter sp.]